MSTKVFISWSGELSKQLGQALRAWLPSALQYVRPYFSPDDIEKGTKWDSEIGKELESSNVGIICLTRNNIEKPWILFESGALSKSLEKGRVCTLLFDLEPTDVTGPLTNFQATRFNSEDFKRLVITINSTAGDSKLEPAVLDSVFDMWWPKLEADIQKVLTSQEKTSKKERRSDRDIMEEILELSRMTSVRAQRGSRITEPVIADLMDSMQELNFVLMKENSEIGIHILRRLARPLKHLCLEAGMSEYYEKFFMTTPLSMISDERTKSEQGGAANVASRRGRP